MRIKRPLKVLASFLLLISVLFGVSFYKYQSSLSTKEIYLSEGFESGITSWNGLDASLKGEGEPPGVVRLTRKDYATPYLMRNLEITESPLENYVLHLRVQINSFTNSALTLGSLIFPTGQLTLVIDRDGNLGLANNLFQKPAYVQNSLHQLNRGQWYDIYLSVDTLKRQATIYINQIQILTLLLQEDLTPVQEIWLGAIWLNGAGDYGAPVNYFIDQVELGNQGMIPQSYGSYLLNSWTNWKNRSH